MANLGSTSYAAWVQKVLSNPHAPFDKKQAGYALLPIEQLAKVSTLLHLATFSASHPFSTCSNQVRTACCRLIDLTNLDRQGSVRSPRLPAQPRQAPGVGRWRWPRTERSASGRIQGFHGRWWTAHHSCCRWSGDQPELVQRFVTSIRGVRRSDADQLSRWWSPCDQILEVCGKGSGVVRQLTAR